MIRQLLIEIGRELSPVKQAFEEDAGLSSGVETGCGLVGESES
jgi:hypothetical protein